MLVKSLELAELSGLFLLQSHLVLSKLDHFFISFFLCSCGFRVYCHGSWHTKQNPYNLEAARHAD